MSWLAWTRAVISGSATTVYEAALFVLGWLVAGAGLAWKSKSAGLRAEREWLERLPAGLTRLAGQLRTGLGTQAALTDFCAQSGLQSYSQGASRGLRWEQMLLGDHRPAVVSLGRLVATHRTLGNDLAGAVEALSDRWSTRLRADQSARVAMAPVLAQARLLAVVMPMLVAMVGLFEPAATALLFTSYQGLTVLAACLALNAVMWAVFRQMAGQLK